jgi:hypothetical protein
MVTYRIQIVSQKTEKTCWEACARMMWIWRHRNLAGYSAAAGIYENLDQGMDDTNAIIFYTLCLGMRNLRFPKGANLRHALKWTPVIIMDRNRRRNSQGHVMVACAYDPVKHKYLVANPQQVEKISFDEAGNGTVTSTAGLVWRPEKAVDAGLDTYMFYW